MIPENYKTLIEKLIDKTKNDKAIWTKTSGEDEFKLDLAKGAITTDVYGTPVSRMIDFRIWNDQGDVVDTISYHRDTPEFKIVHELHALAKRNYFEVDKIVKGIFDELDGDGVIGKSEPDGPDF
jgi:hypothetical protein